MFLEISALEMCPVTEMNFKGHSRLLAMTPFNVQLLLMFPINGVRIFYSFLDIHRSKIVNFFLHHTCGPLPGGLTNYCPSVLDTVGWVI